MVKILTDEENRIPLQTLLPEAMFADDAGGNEAWVNAMHWCDIVVIGPGLGQSEKSARKTEFYLAHAQRMGKPVIMGCGWTEPDLETSGVEEISSAQSGDLYSASWRDESAE